MHFNGGYAGEHASDATAQALKVRIPPNARFGKSVRDEVVSFANRFQINRSELDEFVFAIGEALANAIEHSRSSDVIEVRCQVEGDKIVATVIDSGAGFPTDSLAQIKLPNEFSERGRGLPIMRRCTDIFAVHSVPGKGTAVVLGRYLRRKDDRRDEENPIAS
ncbi:MAG: ATP-binding protein [Candidatus Eremiobacteraeota bacterium]|nr:ATP-binding protein [Candidatus Eremiobacteraeota bacterium]